MPAHNAKPFEVHQLHGTVRSDRAHTYRREPADSRELTPKQRRRLLKGLGKAGREYAREMVEAYVRFTPSELAITRRAAAVQDRVAELEAAIASDGGAVRTGQRGRRREHPLCNKLRAEDRTLTLLLRQLKAK